VVAYLRLNSSESTESDRSKDRQLGGEGTSSGVVMSGMPMEVVREVREDPPKDLEESNWAAKGGYGWRKAAMGGLLLTFVINHLYSDGPIC